MGMREIKLKRVNRIWIDFDKTQIVFEFKNKQLSRLDVFSETQLISLLKAEEQETTKEREKQ